jgi:protein involved in polysaccharide export with SLBB domain
MMPGARPALFRRCSVLPVLSMAMLMGCTAQQPAAPIGPTPVISAGTNLTNAYQLSPGDDVLIRFQYDSDLNDEATIGPDDNVSLQFVNNIQLGGKTVPEATALLNQEYAKYIVQPNIALTVKQYALQEIYVSGQVNSPGLVRDTVPLTLSHAIAEAGGLKTSTAVLSDVLLLRRAPDGSIVYYQINMKNGVAGTVDPLLDSYDLVYVPEKPISQVAEWLGNNLAKIIPYSAAVSYQP